MSSIAGFFTPECRQEERIGPLEAKAEHMLKALSHRGPDAAYRMTTPDGIIMGHRHNNSLSTEHSVKIIQCGCVVGMDDYCVDKRISGEPEQCVFITSENRTVKCLYDIGLN